LLLLLLLLCEGLLQIFFSCCGRRTRHLERWRCVHASSSRRPFIIGRLRIIVNRFKRIGIRATHARRRRRGRGRQATTSFVFLRTPYDVYFALDYRPV
jgi:hypothetical protein